MLIDLKIKTAIKRKQSGYKIYQAVGEPEIIEAETVSEAMQKTTIKQPTKIEKVGIVKKSIFSEAELEEISPEDLQKKVEVGDNILVDDSTKYQNVEENTENLGEEVLTAHQSIEPKITTDDNSNVDMSV